MGQLVGGVLRSAGLGLTTIGTGTFLHCEVGHEIQDLDPKLQAALKEYLLARGVTPELATSLREHLLQKEQAQYRPVLLLIGDAGFGVLDHEMKA
ncbi:hypothetical protein TRIUR3_19200 [Triticum urartu]|uniref:Uncharacterized protein n=1 Tax=Triticum urartu TaxID=4572 RepID=M7YEN1_TRIUA|nr:hypothetical protein TRIUR3_19200 [Triticum urartu]